MSNYIQGCNDGLIIGMTMGLQIVVEKGEAIELPMLAGWGSDPKISSIPTKLYSSSLLLDLGFMSSWALQPTPEPVPMPTGLLLNLIPSDGSWIWAQTEPYKNSSMLLELEFSDGGGS